MPRQSGFLAVLALLSLSAAIGVAGKKSLDDHVTTFQVKKDGSGVFSTKVNGKSCTFNYSVGERKVEPEPEPEPEPVKEDEGGDVSAETIYNNLLNSEFCPQTTLGYWTYKICLSGDISQVHAGDIYVMGRKGEGATMNPDGVSWTYGNGQPCDPLGGTPRKTNVKLACNPDVAGVGEVMESSTCVYQVTVYHPSVCKSSKFPKQLNVAPRPAAPPQATFRDSGVEDWRMELYQGVDGAWICQAQRVDSRFESFSFSSVSLSFDDSLSVEKFRTRGYTVRDHLSGQFEKSGKSTVKATRQFNGELEFIKISNKA